MRLSDPTAILLAHDRWATEQILIACQPLSAEQYHRPFEMGCGSLHATVTHIIGAMRRWGDLLAGREMRPRIEQDETQRPPAELTSLLREAADDFSRSVASHPSDGIVSRELGGKLFVFTRGAVLSHVATHGMHHRAQCLNMLRHLGVQPLPKSSVMEWTFTEA